MKKNQTQERRTILKFAAGVVLGIVPLTRALADVLSELSSNAMVTIEAFSADGKSSGVQRLPKVVKTDAEWRAALPADVYAVTRAGEPDHPYTGSLWNARKAGIYRCICCEAALFDSDSKFESGTGWPSFWQPISALNINRTGGTFSCSRCDAHLGIVVADGPGPSGLRFSACTLALKFEARA
jgi:peptide-methionine (R)-S-oxide reductase